MLSIAKNNSLLLLFIILYASSIDCIKISPKDLLTNKLKNEYKSFSKKTSRFYSKKDITINQNSNCPLLYNTTKELAKKLNLPMPKLIISKKISSKSYASQNNYSDPGEIVLAEDIITEPEYDLDYNQIKALIAHEMAHLYHKHCPKRAIKQRKMHHRDPALHQFYKQQEHEADLTCIKITSDPKALISALNKLDPDNFTGSYDTHPSNFERKKYLDKYAKKL